MDYTQKTRVEECFEGHRKRDCSYCQAHYTKGGICCFGHRFEYDDPQCISCTHNDPCEQLTYQLQERQMERPRRPSIARRRLPIYGQPSSETKGNILADKTQQAVQVRKQDDPDIITYLPNASGENKWKNFFRGLMMMGAWGAGEGALELILGYVRRRRPE